MTTEELKQDGKEEGPADEGEEQPDEAAPAKKKKRKNKKRKKKNAGSITVDTGE